MKEASYVCQQKVGFLTEDAPGAQSEETFSNTFTLSVQEENLCYENPVHLGSRSLSTQAEGAGSATGQSLTENPVRTACSPAGSLLGMASNITTRHQLKGFLLILKYSALENTQESSGCSYVTASLRRRCDWSQNHLQACERVFRGLSEEGRTLCCGQHHPIHGVFDREKLKSTFHSSLHNKLFPYNGKSR